MTISIAVSLRLRVEIRACSSEMFVERRTVNVRESLYAFVHTNRAVSIVCMMADAGAANRSPALENVDSDGVVYPDEWRSH